MFKTLLAHALGAHVNPRGMHTCETCVNKSGTQGAIDMLGAAVRLPHHHETYQRFEAELIDAWKAISKRYFVSNAFGDMTKDTSLFIGANLMVVEALMTQWADMCCNRSSPKDRIGWVSGVHRAMEMIQASATGDYHLQHHPGVYTPEQLEATRRQVLADPISQHLLIEIAEAWGNWSVGSEHPQPSDFLLGEREREDAGPEGIEALYTQLIADAARHGDRARSTSDADEKMAAASKIYDIAKGLFPEGTVVRAEIDEQFALLEDAYKAHINGSNSGLVDAKMTPVQLDDHGVGAGLVELTFDHDPSVEEVAQATYNQIIAAHPQAKITVEQIAGALRGKSQDGLAVMRIPRV